MLRLMLDRSPSLCIPAESGFIPELSLNAADYGTFAEPRSRWFLIRDLQATHATSKTRAFDALELTPDEAERALAAVAPTNYAGAVDALFAACAAKHGKARWGDKTPRNVLHLDRLAELFPDAQFVHIIRDPRAVVASIREVGWRRSFADAAAFWVKRVEAGRRDGGRLGATRYRELRYERLVRDPETELRALCTWLEVAYDPEMLRFHESSTERIPAAHRDLFPRIAAPVDRSRAEAWRQQLDRTSLADVEAVAAELMRDLGYEPLGIRPPAWVRVFRRAARVTKPVAARAIRAARGLASDP